MVKRLSCLPSKQAARVRLPFGVFLWDVVYFWPLSSSRDYRLSIILRLLPSPPSPHLYLKLKLNLRACCYGELQVFRVTVRIIPNIYYRPLLWTHPDPS